MRCVATLRDLADLLLCTLFPACFFTSKPWLRACSTAELCLHRCCSCCLSIVCYTARLGGSTQARDESSLLDVGNARLYILSRCMGSGGVRSVHCFGMPPRFRCTVLLTVTRQTRLLLHCPYILGSVTRNELTCTARLTVRLLLRCMAPHVCLQTDQQTFVTDTAILPALSCSHD